MCSVAVSAAAAALRAQGWTQKVLGMSFEADLSRFNAPAPAL